jgi:hypothetical protein
VPILQHLNVLVNTTFDLQVDELYRQAELCDKKLVEFMRGVNREFPGGVIVHPSLKRRADAEAKLRRTNPAEDPNTLKDIARATIKYDKLSTMYAARNYIFDSGHVAQEKNRYAIDTAVTSGYRDIKFFLDLPIAGGSHICELQLNVSLALIAKELEHPIYEIIRRGGDPPNYNDVILPQRDVEKLGPKMRAVYVHIKQRGMLIKSRCDQLKEVVFLFFEQIGQNISLKRSTVIVPAGNVKQLASMTPALYQYYEQLALDAKVMTAKGLAPQMTLGEFEKLT